MIEKEQAYEMNEDMLTMDGFDDCIMGICSRFGQNTIITYDYDKVISKLMKQKMSYEEAVEFFEYNQLGAGMGENTPCFIEKFLGGASKKKDEK